MKSNPEALRQRGYIEAEEALSLEKMDRDELLELIDSNIAVRRSAAVRVIGSRYPEEPGLAKILLERLVKEKALYTRLEICQVLESGNLSVAEEMTSYLGQIGSNQYKAPGDKVSKKISYPLPRDLIARSLGKMSPDILPALWKVIDKGNPEKVSEVLDAIGFLIFYHREAATEEHLCKVLQVFDTYDENMLIIWKATLCLSAFGLDNSKEKLNEIIQVKYPDIIKEEARRSLKCMRN